MAVRTERRPWVALVVLLLVLAGCGGGSTAAAPTSAAPATTTATAPPPPVADPAAPARILDPHVDMPNPFVLQQGGTYHLFASQATFFGVNLQVQSGPDLDHLGKVREAMPVLPPWAVAGFTWAPDVRRVGDHYVLWFTAGTHVTPPGGRRVMQCIGVAVASRPEGPFVSKDAQPAICQQERRGSIDPRTFRDADGSLWLHWKSDDNADVDGTTHASIYARRLAADGRTLVGPATRILEADQPWEGRIVEAPQLILADGRYWLFYSGNWFNQPVYGIGVAECDDPAGPCHKSRTTPWLGSNAQGAGPGESSLFHDAHGWWIVYGPVAVQHDDSTARPVALAHVGFGADGPYLAAP